MGVEISEDFGRNGRPQEPPNPWPDHEVVDDAEGDDFWEARPILAACRDFARARRVAPWALFGCVLARAAAAVSPHIQLPALVASEASLNVFVALCGGSGSGKSGPMSAARRFLEIDGGAEFLEASPGSGEGLAAAYMHTKPRKGGAPAESFQHRVSVLLRVDEIQSLGSLVGRTNSTLLPTLKTAWTGGPLGNLNAEDSRNRYVPGHRYRLAITAGVQPAHAGAILDDASGGFPQRWLWMPTKDPGVIRPGAPLPDARPWPWRCPVDPPHIIDGEPIVWPECRPLRMPDAARYAVELAQWEAHQEDDGGADALDGQALLSRCKVAALLALLDARHREVLPEDWALAGVVMAVSDRTRAQVIAERQRAATRENVTRARARGIADDVAEEAKDERATQRVGNWAAGKLRAAGAEGMLRRELLLAVAGRDRGALGNAIAGLVTAGLVAAEEAEHQGRTSTRYRWTGVES